jgi:zinc resistance-associated protein
MLKKALVVIGITLLAGFVVSQVYAHGPGGGWGYMMGPGMMGGGWYGGPMIGPGYGGYMGYGPGGYYWETREQAEKWDKFYDETRDARQQLRQKYLELDELLSKKSPDESKVLAKQKEISQLEAQLEEKELQFRLKTPDIGRGGYGFYCHGPGMGWYR